MKGVKKCIILISLPFSLFSQIINSNTLFEIPTAKFSSGGNFWEIGTTFSFAMRSYEKDIEPHPSNIDLYGYFTYSERYLFGLKIYTLSDIGADFAYLIMKERGYYPALACGIRNMTYKRYITPAGSNPPEGGYRDENYKGKFRRNPEIFSLYLVTTKTFSDRMEINLGIGRGEFIGYGPRSKYLNIDYYLNSYNELTFGLFGGIKINIFPYLTLFGEIDGRDLNIGMKFSQNIFTLSFAFTKLEGFVFVKEKDHPFHRFTGAININSYVIPVKPLPAYVIFKIYDKEIKTPLKDAAIKFLETNLPPLHTNENGEASYELMPGSYLVEISLPEYKPLKLKLNISKEKRKVEVNAFLSLKITRKERAFNYITSAREKIKKGELYEAKKDYEEANKIFPAYPGLSEEFSKFLALYESKLNAARSAAREYESKGDLQGAIEAFGEVLRLDPQNEEASLKIKKLSEELARKKVVPVKPKKEEEKAEKPKLSKADIQKILEQALKEYEKANYEKAKELLKKVLAEDPQNAKAKEYLQKTERRLKLLGK
jgi:tetratricopeptide (TPR) repeat protein